MAYIIECKAIGSRMPSEPRIALLWAFNCPVGRSIHFGYLMGAETFYGGPGFRQGGWSGSYSMKTLLKAAVVFNMADSTNVSSVGCVANGDPDQWM